AKSHNSQSNAAVAPIRNTHRRQQVCWEVWSMETEELKDRTRQFGLDVIDLCVNLGMDDFARLVRRQLLRSGTGVAANHRSACRSRSPQEFASRLQVVVGEADW